MRALLLALLLPIVASAQMLFYQSSGDYSGGQKIVLDGSTQYLSITESAGSLDETLDMDVDDFMITFLVKFSALPAVGGTARFCAKYTSPVGYEIYLYNDGGTLKVLLKLGDGTDGTFTLTYIAQPVIGKWYAYAVIAKRSANARLFLDGIHQSAVDISARSGSLSNSTGFFIGANAAGSSKLAGTLDAFRVFRLGYGGIYSAGTGGSNLKIQVGSSSGPVLYSETSPYSAAAPGGLIPLLFRSPYSTLTTLRFPSLENAVSTDILAGWNLTSGWAVGNGTIDDNNSFTTTLNGYGPWKSIFSITLSYRVKATGSTTSSTGIKLVNQNSGTTPTIASTDASGAFSLSGVCYCPASANPTYLYIRNTGTGTTDITSMEARRIGEVAFWRFNGNLLDETGNDLDLTGTGSPTYAGN